MTLRVAWLSYLDPYCFSGGAELSHRRLIEAGEQRGHSITISPFLRNRPQRALRRLRLRRGVAVDWDADLFVLTNVRNMPNLGLPFPEAVVDRALNTGRALIYENAWVDTCRLDLPCGGDAVRCPASCDRSWSKRFFGSAAMVAFVSPMHQRMVNGVLEGVLPEHQILSRPTIDVTRFRRLDLERDIDVLFVGTVNAEKGYWNVLDRFGDDRLTIVGPNHLGEPVRGNYLGPVPYDQLPEIFNRARTFAHLPEWYEPAGRTVVEAALCGCEVITNDRVGVTSFPPADWSEPGVVAQSADRFWADVETNVERLG